MSPLSGHEPGSLEPGEAYKRCLQALDPVRPNHEAAHVYAILVLEESVREVVTQLSDLGRQIDRASRHR